MMVKLQHNTQLPQGPSPCPGATNQAFGFITHEQKTLLFQNTMVVPSTAVSSQVNEDAPKHNQVNEAEPTWAASLATPTWFD